MKWFGQSCLTMQTYRKNMKMKTSVKTISKLSMFDYVGLTSLPTELCDQ